MPVTLPVSAAERWDMYRRIFESIPKNFLDPDHPNNKAIIGAIAYACAYTEKLYLQFEAGMFLDTAVTTNAGDDGISSLARWGIWLNMPQEPGESADSYRLRLMQRLYTPKVTLAAIISAVSAATGLAVTIEETYTQVAAIDAGPFEGQKVMGDVYAFMAIDVITEGPESGNRTAVIPPLMKILRAAGTHWRHIERVAHGILLSLEVQADVSRTTAWDRVFLFPPLRFRPDSMAIDAGATQPTYLYSAGINRAVDHRTNWRPRILSLKGLITDDPITVEATTQPPANLPFFRMDDDTTLWGESVWID